MRRSPSAGRDGKTELLRDQALPLVHLRIELSAAVRVGDAAERLHLLHDLAHGQVSERLVVHDGAAYLVNEALLA